MVTSPETSIRALHLFSNSKWTGPAEPVVNLCRMLLAQGVLVSFACAPDARSYNKVQAMARGYGMEPLSFLRLSKHRHPIKNFLDVRALRRHLKSVSYDLVHCHLDNDTEIALRAVAGLDLPVIRSSYEGSGFTQDRRHGVFARGCAALIEPSEGALQQDLANFDLDRHRLFIVPGAIDEVRFDPGRVLPDMRAEAGISHEAFVLGIVARMQTHRHYKDLFHAFSRFAAHAPEARLVVVGRGTRQEEVALKPVRDLGLESRVHFTGYLNDDAYVGMLNAFDAGLFLTPGTDGTCRAVRELMAMGKPVIVSDRGMLAEIVTHEVSGLVTDGSPDGLFEAMCRLHGDPELRGAYGTAALHTARTVYGLSQNAASVLAIYRKILRRSD